MPIRSNRQSTHIMEEQHFKNKIFEALEKENIAPKPKWQFTVREYAIWGATVLTILAGAIAGGVALYAIANSQMSEYADSGFPHLVATAIGLWLLAFAAMVAIAAFNTQHTKRGYRYPLVGLIAVLLSLSFGVSISLFVTGYGKAIDESIARNIPLYKSIEMRRQQFWSSPEQGRLMGEIMTIKDERIIVIVDENLEEWEVILPKEIPFPKRVQKKLLERKPLLIAIGEKTGERQFSACMVRPWTLHGDRPMWRNQQMLTVDERKLFEARIKECHRTHARR